MNQEEGAESYLQDPSSTLIHNMELETFDLINGFRGREGIGPVALNTSVSGITRAHSEDMLVRGYSSMQYAGPGIVYGDGMNASGYITVSFYY